MQKDICEISLVWTRRSLTLMLLFSCIHSLKRLSQCFLRLLLSQTTRDKPIHYSITPFHPRKASNPSLHSKPSIHPSNTMPSCCPPGSWPQLLKTREELNHNVPTPKGKVEKIAKDLPIYVVEPSTTTNNKGNILVLPDIYSVRYLNPTVRSGDRIGLICDTLADAGYTVVLAGIFRDTPFDLAISAPADGDFERFDSFAQDGGVAWFQSFNYEKIGPDIQAAVEYLQKINPNTKLGVLGFCFGTWALSKAAVDGTIPFDCAVGCHPATALEGLHGGSEVALMEQLPMATKFLWAGNDNPQYSSAGDKDGDSCLKQALEKTGGGVSEYPDMLHGWVSRGDMKEEAVQKAVEKSIDEIIGFFDEKMA